MSLTTGTVSGTPTSTISATPLTFSVTDSASHTVNKATHLTINAANTFPTNLQVIRQGQDLNTATNTFACSIVSKGGGQGNFEPNYNYLGWKSVSGASSYKIYRATNAGSLALYDTVTASAAASTYSTYMSGLVNGGNTYYTAPGIDSAYFDTAATNIIGNGGVSGNDFTANATISSGSTSIVINSISSGSVATGQGVGDTAGNIPVGTTLVSGPGGTGTYTMSAAATANATETVGAVVFGDTGYTYKVSAVVSGVESSQSAYAILPFILGGGFLLSGGAFNSCLVADLTAPATSPYQISLGVSGWPAAAWWPIEPASGPPTVAAPLPNCVGYPAYMNTYSSWGSAGYNLNTVGYKYLNLSVYTAASGAQLSGAPESAEMHPSMA